MQYVRLQALSTGSTEEPGWKHCTFLAHVYVCVCTYTCSVRFTTAHDGIPACFGQAQN